MRTLTMLLRGENTARLLTATTARKDVGSMADAAQLYDSTPYERTRLDHPVHPDHPPRSSAATAPLPGKGGRAVSELVDIRPLMATFPTGVAIVTAIAADGQPRGMTCSSLCSVSLRPPILLVCLRCDSPTLAGVLGSGAFAINFLHDQAQPCAALFASGAPDRFDRVRWLADGRAAGPHLTDAAHMIADCSMTGQQQAGDHVVIFGAVHAVRRLSERGPLLYGLRRYAAWRDLAEHASRLAD